MEAGSRQMTVTCSSFVPVYSKSGLGKGLQIGGAAAFFKAAGQARLAIGSFVR